MIYYLLFSPSSSNAPAEVSQTRHMRYPRKRNKLYDASFWFTQYGKTIVVLRNVVMDGSLREIYATTK